MINKKGFISTSIIYSFFLVFILLMIAILMSFTNKRFLIDKINKEVDVEPDVNLCQKKELLNECLLKMQYKKEEEIASMDVENTIKQHFIKKGKPDLTKAVTKKDFQEMYVTKDDYGDTFYYRGAVDNNYVSFANLKWRVVRINGDNSIRMTLIEPINLNGDTNSDGSDKVNYLDRRHYNVNELGKVSANTYAWLLNKDINTRRKVCDKIPNYNRDKFLDYICNNLDKNISTYTEKLIDWGTQGEGNGATSVWNIGFMKNGTRKIDKAEKLENNTPSDILNHLYSWYANKIETYSNYINENSLFCGNKDVVIEEIIFGLQGYDGGYCVCKSDNSNKMMKRENGKPCGNVGWFTGTCESNGYTSGFQVNYYTSSSEDIVNRNSNISLKCPDDNSTFSLQNLSYPVGLITAKELIFSGMVFNGEKSESYLTSISSYWTSDLAYGGNETLNWAPLSAYYFEQNDGILIDKDDHIDENNDGKPVGVSYIRPVINLKADIKYCSGTGTNTDPYIISDGEC